MSTPQGGFAAPQDAADAIVDEILRRRISTEDAGRQGRRLRRSQQESPWFGRVDVVVQIEAEVEERALLVALAHLLEGGDVEVFVQESVQRRYLTATTTGASTGEIVISREGLALKPS
ncbi:hypothetical protein OG357_38580 (plasmid) [Streptomyces sp. NBC_01255]|uniref:hypothetical protein n=1 Tax=Streptomyces sp. NBC_01255 TaxID=2903798 RepID=UPI002E33275D|nr:hypothetical protein [Streptomyces sp. NBC_01255]